MQNLVRSFVVILAVAVGVSSTGIPIVSPSPPAAVAQECPPNNDDDSIPPDSSSDIRCIAELMRTTRGRINPVCLDDRALILEVEYGMAECRSAPGIQAEAVAQARAIMRLNAAGYPDANDTSLTGVTPNIQWEVESPAGRPDILLYDRTSPQAPIELVEVRTFADSAAADQRMETNYLPGFPKGFLNREVQRFNLGSYNDKFSVVLQKCEEGASERVVRDYEVSAYENAAGILLFKDVGTPVTPCSGVGDPVIVPRDFVRLSPPGLDVNQNGIDDIWEDFEFWDLVRRNWPESEPGWIPDPETLPRFQLQPGLEHVIVPVEVFAVIVVGLSLCAATPACLSAFVGGLASAWGALATEAAAATVATALSAALAAIVAMIGVNVWGDPHMVTFDGLKYDLQSAGEFHIFEVPAENVDVQARFVPIGSRVSVMSRVALEINDTTVEFEGNSLWVNGELATLPATGLLDLGGGAGVARVNGQWLVLWPGYGDRLMMVVKKDRLGMHVPAGSPAVRGLLGDANGDPYDDVALRDGTVLTQPLSRNTLHGPYANSWRVSPDETLFTYGPGESTESFTDLGFPSGVVTLADLSANDRAQAEAICVGAGVTDPVILEACVLDVALTGDSTFAAGAVGVSSPALWISDGYFEDFEDGSAPGWSAPVVTSVENASTKFLGPNAATTKTLTLSALPPHTQALVSFDLHVVGGWDGDTGPDSIEVKVGGGGPTILASKTFSNTSAVQSYPSSGSAAKSGAVSVDDLGSYGGFGSATYHFETTIAHWQETLSVDFKGVGVSAGDGEFWGVDNVEVLLVRLLPQQFNVTSSTTIPAGTGSGSGSLELPRSEDHYKFTIGEGLQGIYVDRNTCVAGQRFMVVDSTGTTVTNRDCNDFEQDLPDGDYTLIVRSTSAATGSYTASLYIVPDDVQDSMSLGGSKTIGTGTPGQNAYLTFEATQGDRVFMRASNAGYPALDVNATVYTPSGAVFWSSGWISSPRFKDTTVIPETGTYTVLINPLEHATGGATIATWIVPADVQDSTTLGQSKTVSTGTPGQNSYLTFEATQGDRVFMRASNAGFPGLKVNATVYAPSGAVWWSSGSLGGIRYKDTTVIQETGTYTVLIDPADDTTGAATIATWIVPSDVEDSTTLGQSKTVSTGTPGQNSYLTFEATQGDRVFMRASNAGYPGLDVNATVYAPSGAVWWSSGSLGGIRYKDTTVIQETGTYTVFINPTDDATGAATIASWIVPSDVQDSMTLGQSKTISTGTPGQNAQLTFEATQGGQVSLSATNGYGAFNLKLTVYTPTGAVWWTSGTWTGSKSSGVKTIPETGSYTIQIDPVEDKTGSTTIALTAH